MTEEIAERKPQNVFADEKRDEVTGMAEAQSAREIGEIQAALVIAKNFPRNQKASMDRILNACARPTLAEHALYQYARGGTNITGPSIRLAESLAQNWGNIQFGIREVEQRGGESVVEAFAWDTETNTRQVKVFHVPHMRYTKKGSYKLEDPRDIYEMVANQGARRLRACILGVIPGDVVEAAVKECEQTLSSNIKITKERVAKMVEMYAELGVTKGQIEARLQRRIESITPGLMLQLSKIYNSIKDGMSSPVDWFEPEPGKEKTEGDAKSSAEKLKDAVM